jgi:hypothetical protein
MNRAQQYRHCDRNAGHLNSRVPAQASSTRKVSYIYPFGLFRMFRHRVLVHDVQLQLPFWSASLVQAQGSSTRCSASITLFVCVACSGTGF